MAEALSYTEASAARELAASQREAARRQELQAAIIQEEEEEIASQEEEAQAARALAASQRAAGRAKGGGGDNVVGAITDTASEIIDLITAAIEIEAIIPPLALLANYHVRFLSGNLGVLQEVGGPASYTLDKLMEIASAGAKTAGKAGGGAVGQAGAGAAGGGAKSAGMGGVDLGAGAKEKKPEKAASPPAANLFEVKKLAIWQIAILLIVDILLALFIVVNFLILAAVPILIAGGIAGTIIGFCLSFQDVCSAAGPFLEDIVSFFTS